MWNPPLRRTIRRKILRKRRTGSQVLLEVYLYLSIQPLTLRSRSLHLDISIDQMTYPSAGLSAYFCRISISPLILSTHTISISVSLSLCLPLSFSVTMSHEINTNTLILARTHTHTESVEVGDNFFKGWWRSFEVCVCNIIIFVRVCRNLFVMKKNSY